VIPPKVVLFICVGNSGRSLMAEAMFNANPPEGWTAVSAGTNPAASVNPKTEPMLRELGLELPPHPPQLLTPEMMEQARVRVTMGCLDDASCPARLKTLELRDWALPDPAHVDDEGFRKVRDQLVAHVKGLRTELVISDRRRKGVVEDTSARSLQ
jgi:protein-tyrosine-phosphatase